MTAESAISRAATRQMTTPQAAALNPVVQVFVPMGVTTRSPRHELQQGSGWTRKFTERDGIRRELQRDSGAQAVSEAGAPAAARSQRVAATEHDGAIAVLAGLELLDVAQIDDRGTMDAIKVSPRETLFHVGQAFAG